MPCENLVSCVQHLLLSTMFRGTGVLNCWWQFWNMISIKPKWKCILPLALPKQSLWETVHLWWLQLTCWYWGCSSIQGTGLHNSSRREHFQTCQRQSLQKLSSACPAVSFERTEIKLPLAAKQTQLKGFKIHEDSKYVSHFLTDYMYP